MKSLTLKHIFFQSLALCSLLLLLFGCNYYPDKRLTAIEHIIDEFPDSALSMLYGLDDTCLNSRKDIEIKNILLTEALYKNDVVVTDDSVISEAADFFDNKLDNKYRAKAYYLKGIINISAKKYSDALISLLNAERSAGLINDSLMSGLIHRSLGDTFSYLKDYSGALNYYKISYSEFNSHKNKDYKDWALYDVARAFYNATQYDSCRITGKYMLTLSDKHQLNIPRKYVLSLMANNEYRAKNYHDALDYYQQFFSHDSIFFDKLDYYMYGSLLIDNGDLDKAIILNKQLEDIDSTKTWLKMRICEKKGDYKNANILLHRELDEFNDMVKGIFSQDHTQIVRSFYMAEQEKKNSYLAHSRNRIFWISVSCILALFIVILILKKKIITAISERDLNHKQIKGFRDMILEKDDIIDRLSEVHNNLKLRLIELQSTISDNDPGISINHGNTDRKHKQFKDNDDLINSLRLTQQKLTAELNSYKERLTLRDSAVEDAHKLVYESISSQFGLFNDICDLYNKFRNRTNCEHLFYKHVTQLIYDTVNDPNVISELKNLVDKRLNNLMSDFYNDIPTLKEEDRILYLYLILKFTPTTISILQNTKVDTVYTRRRNLILKIKKKFSGNPEKYLIYIQKGTDT